MTYEKWARIHDNQKFGAEEPQQMRVWESRVRENRVTQIKFMNGSSRVSEGQNSSLHRAELFDHFQVANLAAKPCTLSNLALL